MSASVHIANLNDLIWQPHPTLSGILTKVFETRASLPTADVMMAQVSLGGEIPWHIHTEASETIHVVQGTGSLYSAPSPDDQSTAKGLAFQAGTLATIPAGLWHRVTNTGTEPLLIFAFHTPPHFERLC